MVAVRRRRWAWLLFVTIATCVGMVVLSWYFGRIDWPASPDPIDFYLAHELAKVENGRVEQFHTYDLGGYLDTERLFRFKAAPAVVAGLTRVMELEAVPAGNVPPAFWRKPPHWWPGRPAPGGRYFKSFDFHPDRRGPDGRHYFVVQDPAGWVYVWVKDNF